MNYDELVSQSKFFKSTKPVAKTEENTVKLNIGSGPNIFPFAGWINYDREDLSNYFNYIKNAPLTGMPPHQQDVSNYLKGNGHLDFRVHDLRSGFSQHADDSVDLIYLGQIIEHLNPIYEVPKLISECYRMLKPGGVLRITTPDLDLLIDAYKNGTMNKFADEQPDFYKEADPSSQLAYIMYGACGPNCTWNNYEGHMFLFTRQSMLSALKKMPFKEIAFHPEVNVSYSEMMAKEAVDAGMSHSFITEALK